MKSRRLITTIALGLSSFGLGINDAGAVTLTHASQCLGITISSQPAGPGAPTAVNPSNGQLIHLDTTAIKTLICPVELPSGLAVPSAAVDAWKNSANGVKVQACYTFAGGFGGACGSVDSTPGSGIQHITVSGFSLSDYNYLKVIMSECHTSGPNCNVLFGYSY